MKISVIDSNYSDSKYSGLAASWLRWEMQRSGTPEGDPEDAEILLVTVSSQQGVGAVKREIKRTGNKRAKIVLGGGGCYAPAIFDDLADVVCVGEGSDFIQTLLRVGLASVKELPEAWIPGDVRNVIPNCNFPWEVPPINHPDGTARVFGSRGCKYKCLFCQTGWETGYSTNPYPERLQDNINSLERRGRRIAIVTNDGAEENVRLSGQQEFLSVRLENLMRLMPLRRSQTKGVRIGVEGVSERLRRAIGKPVDNDELLHTTYNLLRAGIGVRWFFVPGLPGETDGDWMELQYLVDGLRKLEKGVVMMNFHAFIPMPATPLCIFPLEDFYWERFEEFRRWFFHGPGFTRRVQIIAPAQYVGRMDRARESMAATTEELKRGWWNDNNKNWRVQYLHTPGELRKIAKLYEHHLSI